MTQQQAQMNQQQQQPQMNLQQQQYYQGNMQGPPIQSPPLANQFQQPTNDHPAAQPPSPPSASRERYLVGNLSEPFSFEIAPPSIKVSYLGLNGYSLYITGVGFSDKARFNYDEQNNRLTILSLDPTTVGYYSAVDANWQTFVNVLSAINVSSLRIHNSRVSEDNNGSSLVSCSVSIIRSTFKLAEPPSSSNNLAILPPSSLPSPSRTSSTLIGTENLPRLDLFLSTRTQSSTLPNNRIYNDSLNEQILTRTIISQRPLTRADHNGTIQCQVESNNNIDVFVIKKAPIEIEFGPNLETGALPAVNLESEALKTIALECQIEANPLPSYVWYELLNNSMSAGMMPYYGNQNPYGQQYPLQPPSNIPTAGLSVFGTTRQIQRIYQNPGQHAMQCQAQSRGKTIKQEFVITVQPPSGGMKSGLNADGTRGKSYKIPMIIGISIGGVLLLLLVAIIIAALIFLKRRKANSTEKRSTSIEKLPNDKPGKTRRGHGSNLPADYSKYKHEVLKGDSSSTSHLVESADSSTSQPPPVPNRPSPMTSTHSSFRQAPISNPLSYRQASALPGFRPPPPRRSYSPDQDDVDENDSNINTVPLTINRSRTTTPLGSHRSLSDSLHSLKANQQPGLSLPVKKRPHEQPPPPVPAPMVPKRDQRTPSPNSLDAKKDYQHHHYHNPAQLRAQQQRATTNNDVSSEDEELAHHQQFDNATEDSAFLPKKFTFRVGGGPAASSKGYNQGDYHQQQQLARRVITPPPPQKMVVHQPTGSHRDEAPPSYHQVANPPSTSTAYTYQEPTEV